MTNVLEYLEHTAEEAPGRMAVTDGQKAYTRSRLLELSRRTGSALLGIAARRRPVIVYMEKCTDAVSAFLGILYAGAFYVYIDPDLLSHRQSQMQESLRAELVITDTGHAAQAGRQFPSCRVLDIASLQEADADEAGLAAVRGRHLDTDPVFIHFTSGSTGNPKGVLACHRNVIDFIEAFDDEFGIRGEDVLADQAPFDFDANVKDLYSCLRTGARLVLIPKPLFSNPVALLDYICAQEVTVMIWAVSALCLLNAFGALEYRVPEKVRMVLFSGEVMPLKHLDAWMAYLPKAEFVNLYGPTEITCNCTFHRIDRSRDYAGGLPVGRPFRNEETFLLDEEGAEITESGKRGQICVRGTTTGLGYWGRPEETAKRFCQDPRTPEYPAVMYCTGDFGRYNEMGELLFCGRMDDQIKHKGHRIELSEIELTMNTLDGVDQSCCMFDEKKDRIHGFYCGRTDRKELAQELKNILPPHMIPDRLHRLDAMPVTGRGKIDRAALRESV